MPFLVRLLPTDHDGPRLRSSPSTCISAHLAPRERSPRANPLLYRFLLNKWYFDELYDFIFVRPAFWLGRLLWNGGDGAIIDGFGPDGIAARVIDVTSRVVRLQTGYVYHYAFAMLIGVAAFITWYLVRGAFADVRLLHPLRHHLPAAGRRRCSF